MTPERLDKCRVIAEALGWKPIPYMCTAKGSMWQAPDGHIHEEIPYFYTDEAANAQIRDVLLQDYSLSYVRQTDGTMLLQVEAFDHVICANVMECNCEAFLKLVEK